MKQPIKSPKCIAPLASEEEEHVRIMSLLDGHLKSNEDEDPFKAILKVRAFIKKYPEAREVCFKSIPTLAVALGIADQLTIIALIDILNKNDIYE